MTFNIGSQQGTISNVAGNQVVHGGQHTTVAAPPAVLDAIREIRSALPHVALSDDERVRVDADLGGLEQQLVSGQIDHQEAASRLDRILSAVKQAGAVITNATALGTAVTTLAGWLGPVGSALLRFLG